MNPRLDRVEFGAVNGRFQPFHIGHLEYLKAALELCDNIIIGLTNPDDKSWGKNTQNPHRGSLSSNPLSYFQRYEMIRELMLSLGVAPNKFAIVPFRIDDPDLLNGYIPDNTKIYLTIYDDWGLEKVSRLNSSEFQTEVLWSRTEDQKVTTGTEIRRLIRDGKKWEHLVPKVVCSYLTESGAINSIHCTGGS